MGELWCKCLTGAAETNVVVPGAEQGGIVVGQPLVHILKPVGIEGLQGLASHRMQRLAVRDQETGVGDLLRQGMLEDVDRVLDPDMCVEKLQPLQLLEGHFEGVWLLPDGLKEVQVYSSGGR